MKQLWILIGTVCLIAQASASEPAHTDYESVSASQSAQVLGPTGGAGDVLDRLVVAVSTAATGTVLLQDGGGSQLQITAANTPIGVYSVLLGARSVNGAWKITTGGGASVVAVGRFQ